MRKRATKAEQAALIEELADKIRKEMDEEFLKRQVEMWAAEATLVASLDERQKALYEDFRKKREIVVDFVSETNKKD
ncbi:MAG: hypothetical protein IJC72_03740 [Clostridia bacterium]|nr:hypothetical protein [Clostridia bacterium]